jgi:hypothetical protein
MGVSFMLDWVELCEEWMVFGVLSISQVSQLNFDTYDSINDCLFMFVDW